MFDLEEITDEAPMAANDYDTQELSKLIYDHNTTNEPPQPIVRISEEAKKDD